MNTLTRFTRLRRAVRAWWDGRRWRPLALGLPALLAGAGVLILAGVCLSTPTRELERRYLDEGKAALQNKNFARAETCFERLTPTAAARPEALYRSEVQYRLALTAEARGDTARAVALMAGLTPAGGRGYAPAHFWWARHILARPLTPQSADEAAAHLTQVLDGEADDKDQAHGLLGRLYLNRGRAEQLDEAEAHLAKAAQTRPVFRLELAQLHARRGNPTRARQEAELAVRFFQPRATSDTSNHQARLAWASAAALLEDFPTAVGVLDEGLTATREPIYRDALGQTYVGWFDHRERQGAAADELLRLLDKGLGYAPTNRELLNRLLGQLRVTGGDPEKAKEVLRGLAARGGPATPLAHFGLAVAARLSNDPAEEKLHLELAHKLDPRTTTIANNLAWVLLQPPHRDHARALAVIGPAVDREPNNPVLLDTRGRIFLATERWADALHDFEAVLRLAPDTPGVHDALADVYTRLGEPALAAEHRKLAVETAPAPRPARGRP
jgi:Flp pilus assembly protein TadD